MSQNKLTRSFWLRCYIQKQTKRELIKRGYPQTPPFGRTFFDSLYCVHSVVEASRLYFRGSAVGAQCFPMTVCPLTVTTSSFQPDITAGVLSGPVASCGSFSSNVEAFQYTLQNRIGPLQNNLLRFQLGLCESTDEATGSSPGQAQPLCPSSWDNFPWSFDFFFPPKFCGFFFFIYLVPILLGLYLSVSICRY